MENSGFTTRQLTVNALLAAMVAVLATVAITTNAFKITFESFPVFIAGFMFGPVSGLVVGTLGSFIYQILVYGISATTVLWILPYSVLGLVAGQYARKHDYEMTPKQYLIVTIICELLILLMNTGTIYVDSHIYGYYTPALIAGAFGLRLAVSLGKGIAFGLIMPRLVSAVRRAVFQG